MANRRKAGEPRGRRGAGFTLVELLTVVTIVMVLAALSFTQVGKLMGRAGTAKSTENLRQIGVAVAGYAADNDGTLPGKAFIGPELHRLWIKVAYERLYGKPWPDFQPWDTGANLKGTAFFSPNLQRDEPTPWRSYGWNNALQTTNPATGDFSTPPKLVAVQRPSEFILMGDTRNSSSLTPSNVNFRNEGRALLLMADFHVEMRTPEEIPKDVTDPAWSIRR